MSLDHETFGLCLASDKNVLFEALVGLFFVKNPKLLFTGIDHKKGLFSSDVAEILSSKK